MTALRLRLLANGYTPLPNFDKVCLEWNWPRLVVDAAEIVSWKGSRSLRRQATGLRVENGLCVADVDSTDPRLTEGFRADLARSTRRSPRRGWNARAGPAASSRCSAGGRRRRRIYRIQGRKWVRAEDLDKPTEERAEHRLEVFAGTKGGRQFGAFGPHTHDDAGRVLREYHWPGRSPVDVALEELPVLTKAEVFVLVDAFDARAGALGYVRGAEHDAGRDGAAVRLRPHRRRWTSTATASTSSRSVYAAARCREELQQPDLLRLPRARHQSDQVHRRLVRAAQLRLRARFRDRDHAPAGRSRAAGGLEDVARLRALSWGTA